MKPFSPQQVFFEPDAFEYPLGKKLSKYFLSTGVPVIKLKNNRVPTLHKDDPQRRFLEGKKTLVIGVKQSFRFESCRPSADYQFPLVTGCPGLCQYCYLQTRMAESPYIRMYVNIDAILDSVAKQIEKKPDLTTFEISSTSDPLYTEHLSGAVAKTIEFFGNQPQGRLRLVTKTDLVDSLLDLNHNQHTRFRFSLNTKNLIQKLEANTANLSKRLTAASKIAKANYPLGFIIAPVYLYPNWQDEYLALLEEVQKQNFTSLSFEIISHRFTNKAREVILERFPHTILDLDTDKRQPKYGPYGHIKHMYPKDELKEMRDFFNTHINRLFPEAIIEYSI